MRNGSRGKADVINWFCGFRSGAAGLYVYGGGVHPAVGGGVNPPDGGGVSPPAGGLTVPKLRSCKHKTTTMLRMVLFVSSNPFIKRAFFGVFQKQKPPFGGGCFVLDRGAGGSRTRVQARRPYAFYMLILP